MNFAVKCNMLRNFLNTWLEQFAMKLDLSNKDILEIGIAGDEKPSGSYRYFGKGNRWVTMDINPKWKPDIVGDITNITNLKDNSFDLVIMTQTLEHIWEYKKALKEIYRITKKYAIIDCPFGLDFHLDTMRANIPWDEWDDYIRLTPAGMYKSLKEAGFKDIQTNYCEFVTLCLATK